VEIKSLKAQFAAEFINISGAAQIEGVNWEPFQIEYLNNITRLQADVKSRQIAWSFTAALDAYCDSRIKPGNPYVFVSINLDEAKEKIRYLRSIVSATAMPVRPTLLRDSATQIELADGTRFISHPCRPVRGKPQARIYLDEIAHYPHGMDRDIYISALPATTKGDGYLRMGSSPLGAKGLFWEIMTESLRKWPGFTRHVIPWWEVNAFCRDRQAARLAAPLMQTRERVYAYGSAALIEIFENMFLEDFQQEYECAWGDEQSAWISWEVILKNQQADLKNWHADSVAEALDMLEDISRAIAAGEIEPALAGGLDVGRLKDLTEFCAIGKTTTGQLPYRISISLDRVKFEDQKNCLTQVINRLPMTQVLVDQNGIGMQLAEDLARETGKAKGVDFTNATKELWAVEARIKAEKGVTPLPPSRELAYQIHSIKKQVTNAKNNVFDAERNERHHADKFWAWALAIWASKQEVGRWVRTVA
jgi:phage FluMu gp28-like protein